MAAQVNLVWWHRWLMVRKTNNSRAAYEVAERTEDWTTLSQEVKDAMHWAADESE